MAAMASIMMKPPAGLNYGALQRNRVGHINRLPQTKLRVKCIAQDPSGVDQDPQPIPATEGVSPSSSLQVMTNVESVMEIACGRAAMLGFLGGIAVELANGKDLVQQLSSGGMFWVVITVVITLVGTVTPLLQGISLSGPIFSAEAEMSNGRFAMLGMVGTFLHEYVKGGGPIYTIFFK